MDPQQRLLLEGSYAAWHSSGFSREVLLGRGAGVAVGICWTEFVQLLAQDPLCRSVYAATGGALSIASGRLAFVLGLHGPCVSFETACSSSMVACHAAVHSVRSGESDEHLAAGVNLMLLQSTSLSIAIAGMTSVAGRCHAFDRRADGFARGEGCGALILERRRAATLAVHGTASRQDGRSASLTAPNGRAQQMLLRAALADAALDASMPTLCEAHGTGTALGDPIEVRSIAAVLIGQGRRDPLALVGVKSSLGHTEATAGLVGLLALACGLAREVGTNAQLRTLNPNVAAALRGSCALPTQLAVQRGGMGDIGSVSSFGYSGTIAHAAVRHVGPEAAVARPLHTYRRRRAFTWLAPTHPFLQLRIPTTKGMVACFRSPAVGTLRTLVADHVIQGRVVFPAAAYLEAGRATSCAILPTSGSTRSLLHNVVFLQPLVLEGTGLQVECSITDGIFRMGSGSDIEDMVAHCTAAIDDGASAISTKPVGEYAAPSSRCSHAIELHALYGHCHRTGFAYGPSYRTLLRAWTAGSSVARLRSRTSCGLAQLHPADLDGALQLCVIERADLGREMRQPMRGEMRGEMRMPFSVRNADLQCGGGELWAVSISSILASRAYASLTPSRAPCLPPTS